MQIVELGITCRPCRWPQFHITANAFEFVEVSSTGEEVDRRLILSARISQFNRTAQRRR